MGLSDTKSRRKIAKDPNNTKWSKDDSRFGHKIMRAQGWEPGQFLGAKNAAHSTLHTAANASHIRVSLKDDNRGLGFNMAKDDEITGLGVFQDLLGRLNGKTEDTIDQERKTRLTAKMVLYADNKFGPMRFVRGGWLVGDQIQQAAEGKEQDEAGEVFSEVQSVSEAPQKAKAKKRMVKETAPALSAETGNLSKKRRKETSKVSKKPRVASVTAKDTSDEVALVDSAASNRDAAVSETEEESKTRRKSRKRQGGGKSQDGEELTRKVAGQAKKEKRDRKWKRREKKLTGAANEQEGDSDATANKEGWREPEKEAPADGGSGPPAQEASRTNSASSTAIVTGTSTPRPSLRGRHLSRSRFIAQKREALLDVTALNQIFMVKS